VNNHYRRPLRWGESGGQIKADSVKITKIAKYHRLDAETKKLTFFFLNTTRTPL
jgi:hypothetical protein